MSLPRNARELAIANNIISQTTPAIIEKGEVDYEELIKSADADQQKKVKKVMDEWKSGDLKSGSGKRVTDQKQAIAIALNEAGLSKANYKEKLDKLRERRGENNNEDEEKDDVEKSFDDLLEKGGEGSRGGKVVGHNKKGDPIYEKSMAKFKLLKQKHDSAKGRDENWKKQKEESLSYQDKINRKMAEDDRIKARIALREHVEDHYKNHKELLDSDDYDVNTKAKKNLNLNKSEEDLFEKGGAGSGRHKQLSDLHEKFVGTEHEHKFYSTLMKHGYDPADDGESESKMLENAAKHENADKMIADLKKHSAKLKKGLDAEDNIEKGFENLFGNK